MSFVEAVFALKYGIYFIVSKLVAVLSLATP